MDKFDEWNEVKKKINTSRNTGVRVGKIYWISVGQNVGSEIYGKHENFRRPVLVISKFYIPNYINLFLGIPLSSKTKGKSGKMFFKFVDSKNTKQVCLISQIRVFDTKRVISNANFSIKKDDFLKVKEKVINLISQH